MIYALLDPTIFLAPVYLGNVAVYPQFALPAQIKTANTMSAHVQNKWKSYKNIQRACFCIPDENVANQFKVSNVPTLTGWNTSMTIIETLDQLKDFYKANKNVILGVGKPGSDIWIPEIHNIEPKVNET